MCELLRGYQEWECPPPTWFVRSCLGPYLDDAVHVRDEPVDADLEQHDQRATHILAHLRVIVHRQGKQVLWRRSTRVSSVGRSRLLAPQPTHSHWGSTPTSMKVSMLSISAWARSMMNWFTQAMAWDLWG